MKKEGVGETVALNRQTGRIKVTPRRNQHSRIAIVAGRRVRVRWWHDALIGGSLWLAFVVWVWMALAWGAGH